MILKSLLFITITTAFLTSYGQQSRDPKELDLAIPHKVENDKPTAEDFRHSIELTRSQAILTLNGKKQFLAYKSLPDIFKNRKTIIRSKVFSIIIHEETPAKTIVDVLDLLAMNQIKRYKLLSADRQPNMPNITSEAVETDSSLLNITIFEKGYKVEFLNQVTELADTTSLNRYLSDNRDRINPDKVLLDIPAKLPNESFNTLLDVLRKQELFRFRMVTRKD